MIREPIEPPRPADREVQALEESRSAWLLDAAEGTRLHIPILLAITTGMRRGEILAVRWQDVSLDASMVTIRRSLQETKAHGLTCAMGYAPAGDPKTRLTVGWNREANHAWLLPGYERGLQLAAAAGVPNVICFSGNRGGQSDAEGLATCAKGLRALVPTAERLGVTVCMELLNSKVDHADYQCDHTRWGAELVERVGSERFKLGAACGARGAEEGHAKLPAAREGCQSPARPPPGKPETCGCPGARVPRLAGRSRLRSGSNEMLDTAGRSGIVQLSFS